MVITLDQVHHWGLVYHVNRKILGLVQKEELETENIGTIKTSHVCPVNKTSFRNIKQNKRQKNAW